MTRSGMLAVALMSVCAASAGAWPKEGELTQIVTIDNRVGGSILASNDGMKTWKRIGHVLIPVDGHYWKPTQENGVYAFFYMRGPSNVFATAVNAIHIRFSDPPGYVLPEDPKEPLIPPHGLSILPKTAEAAVKGKPNSHAIVTDMPGGTGLFGEWSPRVGDEVLMGGNGKRYVPIPYDQGPDSRYPDRSHIWIISRRAAREIEYFEFENKVDGKVIMKREGEEPQTIAKVLQPVRGVGRFGGSEHLQMPGHVRANHAGVIDVGTTDFNVPLPSNLEFKKKYKGPISEVRGGFQIVPSHHWQDSSMKMGRNHKEVYMVVGPIKDPPNLDRYDMGVEGRYPLFSQGLRGGRGKAYFRFRGEDKWWEINEALHYEPDPINHPEIETSKFTHADGTPVPHLFGFIRDALSNVEAIRVVADPLKNR